MTKSAKRKEKKNTTINDFNVEVGVINLSKQLVDNMFGESCDSSTNDYYIEQRKI